MELEMQHLMDASAADLAVFARDALPSVLDGLLVSPPALAEVASRSYIHDNGFAKIVLVAGRGDGSSLRMHFWPNNSSAIAGNIHNHCWDFSSYVIAGALEFEEFVRDEAGGILASHLLYDSSSGLDYTLRSVGKVGLRRINAGSYVKGQTYSMNAEALHRTWSPHGTTVTLLHQGVRYRKVADVFATRVVQTEAKNEPLPQERLSSLLNEIIKMLP